MKMVALLLLSLLGVSIVVILTLTGGRRQRGAGEPAGSASAETGPTSAPAASGPLADTPAQRQRTERARQLLEAALAIGAAVEKGPPALDGGGEPAEAGAPDPHENRRLIVEDIASSGVTTSGWTRAAPAIFVGMKNAVPAKLARQIEIQRVECYEKGCVADVSYPDMNAFTTADPIHLQDGAFENWPGPRGRTGPEIVASGRIEVTWMLMNPNEGAK